MISIEHLTRRQVALMDIIWAMKDLTEVETFVKSLPVRDAQDCQSLMQIVMYEHLENPETLALWHEDAMTVIETARTAK